MNKIRSPFLFPRRGLCPSLPFLGKGGAKRGEGGALKETSKGSGGCGRETIQTVSSQKNWRSGYHRGINWAAAVFPVTPLPAPPPPELFWPLASLAPRTGYVSDPCPAWSFSGRTPLREQVEGRQPSKGGPPVACALLCSRNAGGMPSLAGDKAWKPLRSLDVARGMRDHGLRDHDITRLPPCARRL